MKQDFDILDYINGVDGDDFSLGSFTDEPEVRSSDSVNTTKSSVTTNDLKTVPTTVSTKVIDDQQPQQSQLHTESKSSPEDHTYAKKEEAIVPEMINTIEKKFMINWRDEMTPMTRKEIINRMVKAIIPSPLDSVEKTKLKYVVEYCGNCEHDMFMKAEDTMNYLQLVAAKISMVRAGSGKLHANRSRSA